MDRMKSPSHSQHLMSMLLALIGLTGTDFTRSMPQLSGKSVFGLLPDLWMPLMGSYDPINGQLDVDRCSRGSARSRIGPVAGPSSRVRPAATER